MTFFVKMYTIFLPTFDMFYYFPWHFWMFVFVCPIMVYNPHPMISEWRMPETTQDPFISPGATTTTSSVPPESSSLPSTTTSQAAVLSSTVDTKTTTTTSSVPPESSLSISSTSRSQSAVQSSTVDATIGSSNAISVGMKWKLSTSILHIYHA